MVLEDVADRPGLLVVPGASLTPEGLGDGDLDVVDELAVPDGLEDAVREPQRQHVLDGLLAEVVVDAEDLFLGEGAADPRGDIPCGCEVMPERLLDDQARPALCGAALADGLDDHGHRLRRDRKVVHAVAPGATLLVELGQQGGETILALLVGKVERYVAGRAREPLPHGFVEVVTAEFPHGVLHALAELVVRPVPARNPDDRELLGQQASAGERVQGREDLPARQVAGSAEDGKRARRRSAPRSQALEQRVFGDLGHSVLMACPPNCSLSAALIFAANDSSTRDAKRA